MKLHLKRPMAFFDIESTGTNRKADRVIDLAIIKYLPDGTRDSKIFRVNPEMPIPAESSRIHGIYDKDVENAPTFAEKAEEIAAYLEGCDLAGYNIHHFDIPILEEEFARAKYPFVTEGRFVIDAQRIYHKKEPRDLTAALKYYCDQDHDGAHGALDDTEATIKVLDGQFEKYTDLPMDIEELHNFCSFVKPEWVDQQGRLRWNDDNDAVINFGRNQNKLLCDLAVKDRGFLEWIVKNDFPRDTREIVQKALNGVFPVRDPEEEE